MTVRLKKEMNNTKRRKNDGTVRVGIKENEAQTKRKMRPE